MEKIKASDLIEIDDLFINKIAKKLKDSETDKSNKKTYLETKEVAQILNVTSLTVRRYIDSYMNPDKYPNSQKLKAVKAGKSWLIKKSDFDKFLQNPKNPKYNE